MNIRAEKYASGFSLATGRRQNSLFLYGDKAGDHDVGGLWQQFFHS